MGKINEDVKAFLGKGVEFNGKLVLEGFVRIDGKFGGEILGKGTVIVGENAIIDADISIDNIFIFGEVRGNLEIFETTEIGSTGKFFGNLKTASFIVQEGATIEGNCRMGSEDVEGDDHGQET
ncbi:MAG: polymer-forming cytoskeletal protein [Deltaproteobacteria bacterium]|nr:polymer-forming cytoskeletal protein [Deltaproteobacteria bacterium]